MSSVEPISGAATKQGQAAAYGLFPAGVNLAGVARIIEVAGLRSQDVCILLPENHPTSEAVRRLSSGYEASAHLQAVLAWLGKFGAVVIRGLGSFVSARRFVTALLSGKGGNDASETVLRGLGLPAGDAQRYASSIATGAVFLCVYCDSEVEAGYAAELLAGTGAQETGYRVLDNITEIRPALRKAS